MKKKTIEEVKEIVKNTNNGEYLLLSERYKNNKEKLFFQHSICGKVFKMSLNKFMGGERCPFCNPRKVKSLQEMRDKIREKNPEMYLIDGYTKSTEVARFYHIPCEREFYETPSNILNGKKCPFCFNKVTGKSERFQNKLNKQFGSSIILLERFRTENKKIKFLCTRCKTKFMAKPKDLLKHSVCPLCLDERPKFLIEDFLNIANIPFKKNETIFTGYLMKFDFFIPEFNLMIDYDGEFYYDNIKGFSSDNKERYKKKMKENYCKEHNIKWLRIPFWQKDNIGEILYKVFSEVTKKTSLTSFNLLKRSLKLGSYKKFKNSKLKSKQ